MGKADRLQRILMGFVLLLLNVFGSDLSHWTSWVAMMIQLELLLTGVIGWCPLYWSLSLSKEQKN